MITQSMIRKSNKKRREKELKKAKYKYFEAFVSNIAITISVELILFIGLLMGALFFFFEKNGDFMIALLAILFVFFTLLKDKCQDDYKRFIILMLVIVIPMYLVPPVLNHLSAGRDFNNLSRILSVVGLLATYIIEWAKICRKLKIKEHKEMKDKKENYNQLKKK